MSPIPHKEGMELLMVEQTFGTEELSCYSEHTLDGGAAPCFSMHPEDAARLGFAEGDTIIIGMRGNEFSMPLHLAPAMAPGVILAPRHHRVHWQKIKQIPFWVTDQQIHKV